ncbi:bifunctional homocysteine S-methyltransferase/methylenetetrahydrofolate reductase [bacterium]|nr:MAG: bifunctional homocysteine S-methyltransferase/methylenetetrahydrofolate reductase [bacterium]
MPRRSLESRRRPTEHAATILEDLRNGLLLADGAMGTMLIAEGAAPHKCLEARNLEQPEAVRAIHERYVEAGADLIETNTFGANALKLADFSLEYRLTEINAAGVRIAQLAARSAPRRVYVAASVGPLGKALHPYGTLTEEHAFEIYREQCAALAAEHPDAFALETLTGISEARAAIRAAKEAAPGIPRICTLAMLEGGQTQYGEDARETLHALVEAGADAIGLNCALGPAQTYEILAPIVSEFSVPLVAAPNAGFPGRLHGRTVYFSSPDYFAEYAGSFAGLGINLIGGCCGTTPAHTAAMRAALRAAVLGDRRATHVVSVQDYERPVPITPARRRNAFEERLGQTFVITAEIEPPRGIDFRAQLAGARVLEEAGVDAVDLTDNQRAQLRMSPIALASLLMQHTSLATILHFSCRDRNLLALQSELLGAAALGITAILALTGDPAAFGDYPVATGVYDVTSVGLVGILRALNEGKRHGGIDIGPPAAFKIGVTVNPLARDLDVELARFRQKITGGAHFALTQPLYEIDALKRFVTELERAEIPPIPILAGVLPLRSARSAEFLHNEVPGMFVPLPIRERMRRAGEDGAREGVRIAQEFLREARALIGGAYVIPMGRYQEAAEVIAPIAAMR